MKKTIFLSFIFLFIASCIFGQNKLLEPDYRSVSSLNSEEYKIYKLIVNNPIYSSHHFIKFNSLIATQSNSLVEIDNPLNDCIDLVYSGTSIEYVNEDDYTWYGEIEQSLADSCLVCKDGHVLFHSSSFGKNGVLRIDNDAFEISEISADIHLISEISVDESHDECSLHDESESESVENPPSAEERGENINCNVDLLLLYTPAALEDEGSVDAVERRARLGVTQFNQSLRNSDVNSCQLQLNLIGVELFELEEMTTVDLTIPIIDNIGIQSELRIISDNHQEFQDLIANTDADLVLMMTGDVYDDATGTAWLGPPSWGEERPFGLIESIQSTAIYTMGHELGHLFGCDHDEPNEPQQSNDFAKGYNFRRHCNIVGKHYGTVLNVQAHHKRRLLHFSNPDVRYNGVKTGKDDHNNARQLRSHACEIASYKEGDIGHFSTSIIKQNSSSNSHVIHVCPCDVADFEAIVSGGAPGGNFTYEWQISTDGVNYGPVVGTSSTFWVDMLDYCSFSMEECYENCQGNTIHLRLTVTDSYGNVRRSYRPVLTSPVDAYGDPLPDCSIDPFTSSNDSETNILNTFVVDMNSIQAEYITKSPSSIRLDVRSINGASVFSIKNTHNIAGKYSNNINSLQSGMYVITLYSYDTGEQQSDIIVVP